VITVREALQQALPARSGLEGGARGLGNVVTWASILRQTMPALEPPEGGEMILVSFSSIGLIGKEARLTQMIARLHQAGVAALAVQGQITEQAKATADELGLPLIRLPDSALLSQVERAVIRLIMERESRQDTSQSLRSRLEVELVADLLAGKIGSDEALSARAARLGRETRPPYLVYILSLGNPAGEKGKVSLEYFGDASEEVIRRRDRRALLRRRGKFVDVVTPVRSGLTPTRAKSQVEAVRREVETKLGPTGVLAGLARSETGLQELAETFAEARQSIDLAPLLPSPVRTVCFGDLGVRGLLFRLRNSADLLKFYRDALGDLEKHDSRNGGELRATLKSFFAHNGNRIQTAADLHLHRNSLAYRLRRIEEITGVDLDSPDVRLRLQLALEIGEILALPPS
jgi:sugar diacid utilization regulator